MRVFNKLSNMFNTIVKKYKRATPKQLVMAGVFMLAFAGAIGAGLASKSSSFAAGNQTIRDCSYNSIDHHNIGGGCGALTAYELCVDLWTNSPSDLRTIYKEFGLDVKDCDNQRFFNEAVHGVINKKGELIVDGQVVMTDVWTMGRTTLNGAQPTAITVGGKTYYHSHPSKSFGQNELDAIVWFNDDGEVQFAVLEACGNPVTRGKKIPSGAKCEDLVAHEVKGKKNTYQFSTKASKYGLAKYVKFNYYVNGELVATTNDPSAKTKEITLTKDSTVRVEIEISLPGGKKKTIKAGECEKKIPYEKEEKFIYACKNLYATSKDNITFRFFAVPNNSANVKAVSADFELDGAPLAKGVTTKNDKGEFYTNFTFKDEKTHTVRAVINFEYTKDGKTYKVQSKEECKTKVTPKQPPVCEYNPNLPPDHPDCQPPVKECKPGIPEGDPRCETCEDNPSKEGCELPKTGPAGVAALFAGVTAAGTIGHRLYTSYRNRR